MGSSESLPVADYSRSIAYPHLLACGTSSHHAGASRKPALSCSRYMRQYVQKLSSELLISVLEQLRHLDAKSIFIVRSVCKIFNVIATPIAYRKVTLNEMIVHPDAQKRFAAAMEHISAYTNHVIIRSNLMPSGIRRILSGIARLSSITLHYVRDGKVWSISDVLDFEQLTSHKTKVSIENLPLGGSQNDLHESLLDPVLTKHLVSLQLAKPTPPLTTKVDTLKRLLIQCPSLETLQYEDMGRGTQFAFGAGECLPPVSNLVLKSYDWAHSADEVEQHWDLSRIRSLSLVSVPIINFLCSISPHDLSQLTYLQAHDSLTQGLDRQEDATRGLYLLVRNYIRALEVLDITCHTRLFPIDSVMQHGDSLRELHFRDHVGFRRDDDRCPTLCPRDVAVLAENLPFLHTLELDMDASLCCPPEFLQAVSSFPMLQTLILHVQTVVHPNEADDLGRDRDYEAAIQTFSFLVRQREKTNPDMPWKCMTINVGGWRKVMLRRMSSEWRRKNACGVFAERCFVLKRDKTGQYNIQEEMCYDTSQYISSAQL